MPLFLNKSISISSTIMDMDEWGSLKFKKYTSLLIYIKSSYALPMLEGNLSVFGVRLTLFWGIPRIKSVQPQTGLNLPLSLLWHHHSSIWSEWYYTCTVVHSHVPKISPTCPSWANRPLFIYTYACKYMCINIHVHMYTHKYTQWFLFL